MVIAHCRYLVLKMSLPNSVLKVHGDHSATVSALEKLQALEAAVGHDG
jgi:hypothetical protein